MADPQSSTPGYVYFVLAPEVNRVKIGYSAAHPESRLRELQIGCPVTLFRLGYVDGDESDETWLHDHFDTYRIRGEWFVYALDIRDFVAEFAHPWFPKKAKNRRVPVPLVRSPATTFRPDLLEPFLPANPPPYE